MSRTFSLLAWIRGEDQRCSHKWRPAMAEAVVDGRRVDAYGRYCGRCRQFDLLDEAAYFAQFGETQRLAVSR